MAKGVVFAVALLVVAGHSLVWGMERPKVLALEPSTLPPNGERPITLLGENFVRPSGDDLLISIGDFPCTVVEAGEDPMGVAAERAVCNLAPGVGADLAVNATSISPSCPRNCSGNGVCVGGFCSCNPTYCGEDCALPVPTDLAQEDIDTLCDVQYEQFTASFPRPLVSSVQPSNAQSFGGKKVTVTGKYFGPSSAFASEVEVSIGGTPCIATEYNSPTEAVCTLPARTGKNVAVTIAVGGQTSVPEFNSQMYVAEGVEPTDRELHGALYKAKQASPATFTFNERFLPVGAPLNEGEQLSVQDPSAVAAPRYGHGVAALATDVASFGGRVVKEGKWEVDDSFFVFSTHANEVSEVDASGPSARWQHSMLSKNNMVVRSMEEKREMEKQLHNAPIWNFEPKTFVPPCSRYGWDGTWETLDLINATCNPNITEDEYWKLREESRTIPESVLEMQAKAASPLSFEDALASLETLLIGTVWDTNPNTTSNATVPLQMYNVSGEEALPTSANEEYSVVVLGGVGKSGEKLSDQWEFNFFTREWRQLASAPGPTFGHCVGRVTEALSVVFGGSVPEDELWYYSHVTDKWFVDIARTFPPQRYQQACASVKGNTYMVGGIVDGSSVASRELWVLDHGVWAEKAPAPAGRKGATVVQHEGFLVVFGGEDSNSNPSHTLYLYDVKYNTWASIEPSSYWPLPLTRAGGAVVRQELVLWGGKSLHGSSSPSAFPRSLHPSSSGESATDEGFEQECGLALSGLVWRGALHDAVTAFE